MMKNRKSKGKTIVIKVTIVILSLVFGFSTVMADSYLSEAADTSKMAIGAQSLGLGQSGVAISDIGAVVNPASLANAEYVYKWNTMYTSLLGGDINYLVLGTSFRSPWGCLWSVNYINGSSTRIRLRDTDGNYLGSTNYSNGTLVFSSAKKLTDRLNFGLNFKLYSQSADDVNDFRANGQEMDMGFLYKFDDKLSFGVNFQNFLPQGLGGNIHWENGHDDSVAMNTKLGLSYEYNDLWLFSGDIDFKSNAMALLHLGGQYRLLDDMLAFRLGLDQSEKAGDEIINDITLGLGFNYKGFVIDYAYHPTSVENDNVYHYFTFSYVGDEKYKASAPVQKEYTSAPVSTTTEPYRKKETPSKKPPSSGQKQPPVAAVAAGQANRQDIHIIQPMPTDKVYDESINVRILIKSDLDKMTINGYPIRTVRGGIVGSVFHLNYGKNVIDIRYEKNGKGYQVKRYVLRLPKYKDVGEGRWSKDVIEHMGAMGLYWGGAEVPDYFKPKQLLTIRDLGEIIAKYKQIKIGSTVDVDQATYDIIKMAKDLGYPGGLTPKTVVNRALACVVVTKIGNVPLNKVVKTPFVDVYPGRWYTDRVMAAKNAGWVSGVKTKGKYYFFPGNSVNRETFLTLLRPLLDREISMMKVTK